MTSRIKVEVDYGATSWRSLRAKKKAEYYRCKKEALEEKAKYDKAREGLGDQDFVEKAKFLVSGKWLDDFSDTLREIGLNPLGIKPLTPYNMSNFIKRRKASKASKG